MNLKDDDALGDIMSELTAQTSPAASMLPPRLSVLKRNKAPKPRSPSSNPFVGQSIKKRKLNPLARAPAALAESASASPEVMDSQPEIDDSTQEVGDVSGERQGKKDEEVTIEDVESQVRY